MTETKELENGGFDVEINLTDLCENHLIKNISKIIMPKGINVIPITWDTNEVDEYFNVIKTYIILLLEQRQKSNKDFTGHDWNGNHVLLFGSEGYGLKYQTLKNSDFLLKIDINNNVESLNISNSAAVVFHFINNLRKKS